MESLTVAQQELFDWLVSYIQQHEHPPTVRQMMQAMKLKSPAPIQSRLEHLRAKGYIHWVKGQARTLRILHSESVQERGIPILGAIAAGGLIEPFIDQVERLDLVGFLDHPQCFALRVTGDSMIEDLIAPGDMVLMQPVPEPDTLKNGTIVAARVEGEGTTLKHFYRQGNRVILQPGNANYAPIEATAAQVQVQGALVAVWRDMWA